MQRRDFFRRGAEAIGLTGLVGFSAIWATNDSPTDEANMQIIAEENVACSLVEPRYGPDTIKCPCCGVRICLYCGSPINGPHCLPSSSGI